MQIETKRLLLRTLKEEDALAVSRNSRSPQAAHFLSDMVFKDENDAQGRIVWANARGTIKSLAECWLLN